ncbi:MAG TPA: aminoglycoside phosphotransferase family protein [Chloroflexota bacterium]|nr:aminoglycoside phosphotransferase family protein [Chloroflexota bacterium]
MDRLAPVRPHWTGIPFTAMLRDGSAVFVKVFPRKRLPPTALPALPVLVGLGLREVPRPVASLSGAFHEPLGEDVVVVFEHVDAPRVDSTTLDQARIGDLIGRLHQQPQAPLARETFDWPFEARWRSLLAHAVTDPPGDAMAAELRAFLREHEPRLTDAWGSFEKIITACRAATFEMVLTHGDWRFNLLHGADDAIHLVDWDELLLAPPERDTWFATDDPDFLRGYRTVRGSYEPSELATAYYVHGRCFEDLTGMLAAVVEHDDPAGVRSTAVARLSGPWMIGLRERIARFRLA